MKRKDVFIGNINLCLDLWKYEHVADKNGFVPIFKINGCIYGESCVIMHKKDAVLIKARDNKYIWLDTITGVKNELFTDLGINLNTLDIYPTQNNLLYVDCDSLKPYFGKFYENDNKNIRVKSIKKEINYLNHHKGNIELIK